MYVSRKVLLSLLGATLIGGSFSAAHCEEEQVSSYAGFYVGAGLSYQYTKGAAYLDDNLDIVTAHYTNDAHGYELVQARTSKLGGVISGGYGWVLAGRVYAGVDLDIDITGNKTKTVNAEDSRYGESRIKTRGIVPTLAIRVGGIIPQVNCLAYARLGLAFAENKFENDEVLNKKFETKSYSPVVGIGIEKSYCRKISVRCDIDYRFASDDTKRVYSIRYNGNGYPAGGGYEGTITNKARGYAVRLMGIYRF